MSSHVLAEVAQTVDRVMIIFGGSIVASLRMDALSQHGMSLGQVYLKVASEKAQ